MASSNPSVQDSRQLTDLFALKVAGFDDVPTFHRLDLYLFPKKKYLMNRFDQKQSKTAQATSNPQTANLSNAGDWRAMTEAGGEFNSVGFGWYMLELLKSLKTIPDVCSRFVERNFIVCFQEVPWYSSKFGEMSDVYFCDVGFVSNHVNLSVSLHLSQGT